MTNLGLFKGILIIENLASLPSHRMENVLGNDSGPDGIPHEDSHFGKMVGNQSLNLDCYSQTDLVDANGDPNGETKLISHSPYHGDESTSAEEIELPSNVTNREQIFMPLDIKSDDPRIYGKWMIFSNGDICLQDQMWIQLSVLILKGLVILQESSTVKARDRGRSQGVIKCYTRGGTESIKKVWIAIHSIIKEDVILHYKSNKASKNSLSRRYGERFITEYMLTSCGGFYEKDELDRWKKVKDGIENETSPLKRVEVDSGEKVSSMSFAEQVYLTPQKRRLLIKLPSQETSKIRYFYPAGMNAHDSDGLWSLFCDISDFDGNGMSELDRMWAETKKLCDEGVLSFTSCETGAFSPTCRDNPRRRCVIGVVKNCVDSGAIIRSGERLRERTDYNIPMYFKFCHQDDEGKKWYDVKYLYTDDRELYEYTGDEWQLLVKRSDAIN